ncbi:TonB-dependent receptor domain-containing protein [Algoriphagus boritolerans]|uniref:TonB-dependent receptor domain-containing protein n=1 Tax=Algoriphagus boritolerans TaxID=308111 RepID=UPI002FCE0944
MVAFRRDFLLSKQRYPEPRSLDLERKSQLTHAKWTASYDFSDRLLVKNGVEYFRNDFSEVLTNENLKRTFNENQGYLFSEWDWYFSRKLVLRSGLRAGISSLADEKWLDPRTSLAYKISENGTLSLAAGRFHQLPEERFRVLNPNLKNTESRHLILNYLYQKEGKTFRAEAFHKSYDHLVRFEGMLENPQQVRNEGKGFARGFDVFFSRPRKS